MFGYEVNSFAVLAVGVLYMVLGYFWYSPSMFGGAWMQSAGISPEKIAELNQRGMFKSGLLSLFTSFITAFILAVIIGIMGFTGVTYGAVTGLLVWAGFMATSHLGPVLWEGKPMKLYAINAGYYFVSLLIMGAILGAWR